MKKSKEKLEIEAGKGFKIKITTTQIIILVLAIFLVFFSIFMTTFPDYTRKIYGNESIPETYRPFLIFTPIGLMLGTLIVLLVQLWMTYQEYQLLRDKLKQR